MKKTEEDRRRTSIVVSFPRILVCRGRKSLLMTETEVETKPPQDALKKKIINDDDDDDDDDVVVLLCRRGPDAAVQLHILPGNDCKAIANAMRLGALILPAFPFLL